MFEPRFSVSALVFLHVRCLYYLLLCRVSCVTLLCTAVLTIPLFLVPFQCTNSPFFLFSSTRALDMQWKIKSILFCINKLLFLGVQGFVYRCVTPGMHPNWLYKCWRESGRAERCPWADTQGLPGPGWQSSAGACVSWGNGTRTSWEEPVLLQKPFCHLCFVRSILFCIKEKRWCLCFFNSCICLLLCSSSLATWWQLLNSVVWTVVLLPVCIALVSSFKIQHNTIIKQEYNLL